MVSNSILHYIKVLFVLFCICVTQDRLADVNVNNGP